MNLHFAVLVEDCTFCHVRILIALSFPDSYVFVVCCYYVILIISQCVSLAPLLGNYIWLSNRLVDFWVTLFNLKLSLIHLLAFLVRLLSVFNNPLPFLILTRLFQLVYVNSTLSHFCDISARSIVTYKTSHLLSKPSNCVSLCAVRL